MSTSRRNFLKTGSVMALAVGAPLSLAKAATAEPLISSPETKLLTKKDFAAYLNSEFVIQNGANKVKTRLVEVSDLPKPARSTARDNEGFSLVFQGDRSQALNQSTYIIEHKKLGKFSFLLVPSPDPHKTGTSSYIATINRMFG